MMIIKRYDRIVLPALRGKMGNWIYYSCLMNFKELALRVSYANEVHENKSLSDMIQRELELRRSVEIERYLIDQPERFFNSLVVATYGGDPNWHALANVKTRNDEGLLGNLTDETIQSVGFLTLNGDEKLFAVDGQHRLSGIKRMVANRLHEGSHDEVSVIFVAHDDTSTGLRRTRRLFTTLNKTARSVSKGGIIALDEDDVMAICVRRLVEDTQLFKDDRVAFVAGNNMPASNEESLTTIGNLYDVLGILFTIAHTTMRKRKSDLQRIRPSDESLEEYFVLATKFFHALREDVDEIREFFDADDTRHIVRKHRGNHGGSSLFRPIGIEIFTRIVARLTKQMSLSDAVMLAAKLPRTLNNAPYVGLMWDPSTRTISNAHKVTLREILLHMIGASKMSEEQLKERYRRETRNDRIELPTPIV